jgi:predicted transcriptional regulator
VHFHRDALGYHSFMATEKINSRTGKSKRTKPNSLARSSALILARIEAGIDAANNGKFATSKQVKTEFARWRGDS